MFFHNIVHGGGNQVPASVVLAAAQAKNTQPVVSGSSSEEGAVQIKPPKRQKRRIQDSSSAEREPQKTPPTADPVTDEVQVKRVKRADQPVARPIQKGKGKAVQPPRSSEDSDFTGIISAEPRPRRHPRGGPVAPQAGPSGGPGSSSPAGWGGMKPLAVEPVAIVAKVRRDLKAFEKYNAKKMQEVAACIPKGKGFQKFTQINKNMQEEWKSFREKLNETLKPFEGI